MSIEKQGHAIVIGSSIAGLTAARVLTDYFAKVTIIERDQITGDSAFRKGVPHARHPHALLLKGQMILEELFPGLVDELHQSGAVTVNFGLDTNIYLFGKWREIRYQSRWNSTSCSRPLLEGAIYRRMVAHPQVTLWTETEVVDLCVDDTQQRVTGVQYRLRQKPTSEPHILLADLVVDASGRDSHTPQWLEKLGYTPPKEIVVNAFPGYSTRIYQRPARTYEWKLLGMLPSPDSGTRGGVLFPLEGDRWHVTLIGMAKDYPPTDEEGYWAFARSLPDPLLYEVIKEAEPLTPPFGYRRAENRLRLYDKLPRYLENFLVFGDAVFAFNPIYGQGMTAAAISSLLIGDCLQKQPRQNGHYNLTGLAQRFQKRLVKIIREPWQMATGQDRLWAVAEGVEALDLPTRIMQNYMTAVLRTLLVNEQVSEAFAEVQQMISSPTIFFQPSILFAVLRHSFAHNR